MSSSASRPPCAGASPTRPSSLTSSRSRIRAHTPTPGWTASSTRLPAGERTHRRRRTAAPRRSSAERQSGALLGLGAWPEDAALALVDPHIVDARLTATHVALAVELPLLVAVASPPLAGGVTTLVLEAHGDPVVRERPQILAKRIVELALPLAAQELDDPGATRQPLLAVAQPRVLGVGRGHSLGVARVPRILCRLNLLARGRFGERGYGRSQRVDLPAGRAPGASARLRGGRRGARRLLVGTCFSLMDVPHGFEPIAPSERHEDQSRGERRQGPRGRSG